MKSNGFIPKACLLLLAGAVVALPAQALASTVTFNGSDVGGRSAEVGFTLVGTNQLNVTLTNKSTAATAEQAYILTAVFFDLEKPPGTTINPSLTPVSAVLTADSHINCNNVLTQAGGYNVGGEWAYKKLASDEGISSVVLGNVFGNANFNGPAREGGASVEGLQYGIIGSEGIALNSSGNVVSALRDMSFIQNSVDFILTDGNLAGMYITNVRFQYGNVASNRLAGAPAGGVTSLGGAVPEPLTMFGAFLGISSLGMYIRRRTKVKAV